jgi:ankyrin repeat protein
MILHLSTNTPSPPLMCFLSLRVALAAPVSSQGKYTPLHMAAVGGHAEVVKVLLAAGANVYASTEVSVRRG